MFACSREEASQLYPDAEPIEGTMVLRELDDDAPETAPDIFRRKAHR
jgi:hypothetical protein